MDRLKQVLKSIAIAIFIFAMGTTGYIFIENWNLIDSAYMTAITLSTVGFSEIHAVSTAGRIFTMFLIFSGVGYFLYLAGVIMQIVVEGELVTMLGRRKLDKAIKRLNDHYIVCGYGRIGKTLCNLIREEISQIVVIEQDEALVPVLEQDNMLYLHGDASDEILLEKAEIKKAQVFVAALATDTANVFLVLTARQLNPDILIMARASTENVKQKLLIAGANIVESPYDTGAASMGLKLLRPSVSSFLDIATSRSIDSIQIEESIVSANSKYANVMLKDSGIRQEYDLIIIAIKKESGGMHFNPAFDTIIEPGGTIISMGKTDAQTAFHKALNSS
ncbi:MAG: potassium channel protein [Desulfobacteraceae bacterium]|nr:potassium channel protein [Desulfobacteraceae bacterium]